MRKGLGNFVLEHSKLFIVLNLPFDLPVDLKFGRQYITMGRGNGVTTLNLFAPADLRYITDLAATLPITGVRTDWYWNDFVVTGVGKHPLLSRVRCLIWAMDLIWV